MTPPRKKATAAPIYRTERRTVTSADPSAEHRAFLRELTSATDPAAWLALVAPLLDRNHAMLAENLRRRVEADPLVRDAVYVALLLAGKAERLQAQESFGAAVAARRKQDSTLIEARRTAAEAKRKSADKAAENEFAEWTRLRKRGEPIIGTLSAQARLERFVRDQRPSRRVRERLQTLVDSGHIT
jgi:hypothetical protein